ncbi:MAG TPA: hypothetical protein P5060_00485 [Candidatus Absconditabacterales bacterium]|nr:hypothetical protein [Candidatus Absconditabacterales bacterium]
MLKQIVLGLLFMAGGIAMIYYSSQLVNMFGRNQRAETNLGGTKNAIVLFGFALIVVGTLFMFGVLGTSSPVDNVTSNVAI